MNDAQKMNIEQFEVLLDTHGADPSGWPGSCRPSAELLLAASSDAQLLRTRAEQFAGLLAQDATISASPELRSRILAQAPGTDGLVPTGQANWRALWPFGPIWRPATALLCATVLGIYVGIADPAQIFGEQTAQASVANEMIVLADRSGFGLEEVE